MPRKYKIGSRASRLCVRRAHFGRIDDMNRIFSAAPTFGDQHLTKHPTGAFAGEFPQGIVDRVRLTQPDDRGLSRHGVSLLPGLVTAKLCVLAIYDQCQRPSDVRACTG
jgi:hypothetical protein